MLVPMSRPYAPVSSDVSRIHGGALPGQTHPGGGVAVTYWRRGGGGLQLPRLGRGGGEGGICTRRVPACDA